jgi:tRNA A-37 threonylcarbamoyl transferase component Bud32
MPELFRESSLDFEEKLWINGEITGILAFIHDHLMNHIDTNSFNFLVAEDGRPCFIDFSIASMMRQARSGRSGSSTGGD